MLIPIGVKIQNKWNFGREKPDLLYDARRGLFSDLNPKLPSNAVKKSEMHSIMCKIASSIRNT